MNDDNDENDEKYSNGWMREEVSIEALKNEIKTKEKKQTNLSIFARAKNLELPPDFADSSTGGGGSSYQVATSGSNSNGRREEEVSVEALKIK